MEKKSVRRSMDVMDLDVELSVPIYREHSGLDHRGSWAPTVAGVRLVYGWLRTEHGFSYHVSAGNALFTLIGFMGMYTVLSVLFLFLIWREVAHGPEFLTGAHAGTVAERFSTRGA